MFKVPRLFWPFEGQKIKLFRLKNLLFERKIIHIKLLTFHLTKYGVNIAFMAFKGQRPSSKILGKKTFHWLSMIGQNFF